MEKHTHSTSEQANQTQTFGKYIPHYLRDELMKAQAKQQEKQQAMSAENTTQEKGEVPDSDEQTEPSSVGQSEVEPTPEPQADQVSPHSTENLATESLATESHSTENPRKEENDVNAWKGRLKKEQAERQQLNARLIEEAEARAKLEARLLELEQAKTQTKSTAVATPPSDPQGLSEMELEDLKLINPDLYLRLKTANEKAAQSENPSTLTAPTTAPQAQTHIEQPPVMSPREQIWYTEVQREIPEVQGLLGDPNFVAFAKSKTDWTGESGYALIQRAGVSKEVRFIPAIRHLLDAYQQSKTATTTPATVPPQKTAPVKAKVATPKTMTSQDEAKAEMLARTGKTAELKQFLAQFK